MTASPRMTAPERRESILLAAGPLFAHEGFRGVTTKAIAKKARVSEALLYQHFPSKEVLFDEVQSYFCRQPDQLRQTFGKRAPSTKTLVESLYLLVRFTIDHPAPDIVQELFPRIMLHSILDDGEFARRFLDKHISPWAVRIDASIKEATACGDIENVIEGDLRFWFAHHLSVMVNMFLIPEKPVLDYGAPRAEVARAAFHFILRGIGLTPQAREKYGDFDELGCSLLQWLGVSGVQTVSN